jgi:hypothetical protein
MTNHKETNRKARRSAKEPATVAEPQGVQDRGDNSPSCPTIFQTDPPYTKPSMFKAKSWTDSVAGHIYESHKLTKCILRNERLMEHAYQWHVTIKYEAEQPPSEIRTRWSRTCKKLKKSGVIALWVIEVSRSNCVHFHIIVSSRISKTALAQALEDAMPSRETIGWHKSIQRIEAGETWELAHYVTKARISRFVGGRPVEDYYANKRVLFQPNLGLRKHGTIGPFWVKPKAAIWRDIIATEESIAEGLEQPGVRRLVGHVYELLDRTVPLKKLERSFGLNANRPTIKQWADMLLTGDDGDFESING